MLSRQQWLLGLILLFVGGYALAAAQPAPAPAAPGAQPDRPAEIVPETVAGKHRKSVFDAYVQSARAGDWKKAAGYFDPSALAKLHETMSSILSAAAAKGNDQELFKLFGATSAEAYAQQTPGETFASFMGGLSQMVPTLQEAIANAEFQYLGEVQENDDLVHIVYRTRVKVGDVETAKIAASSMTKTPAGWRLLLDDEVEGFAKMLKQQVAGDNGAPDAAPRPGPTPSPRPNGR